MVKPNFKNREWDHLTNLNNLIENNPPTKNYTFNVELENGLYLEHPMKDRILESLKSSRLFVIDYEAEMLLTMYEQPDGKLYWYITINSYIFHNDGQCTVISTECEYAIARIAMYAHIEYLEEEGWLSIAHELSECISNQGPATDSYYTWTLHSIFNGFVDNTDLLDTSSPYFIAAASIADADESYAYECFEDFATSYITRDG